MPLQILLLSPNLNVLLVPHHALTQGGSKACRQTCSWGAHSNGSYWACSTLQGEVLPPEKVAHGACFTVDSKTHLNMWFPRYFLHVLLCAVHSSIGPREGPCPLGGYEGIVAYTKD